MAFTERLALLIDAKAGGAITELNKLNAEINMVNQTQVQATGVTGLFERGLAKVGIQSQNTAALLQAGVAAGAATAGYAMLRFAKDAVSATTSFADGIRSIQQATGLSATTSSRLNAVLDDFGISADKGSTSLARLARNLYGNESALQQYGVTVAKNRDGSLNMEKTLVNIANAYQNLNDPAAKASLVVDAFGKSGRDLIPILNAGGSALRDMFANVPDAQLFSQEQIDQALQYKLAMDNVKDSFDEIKFTLGNALLPTITDVANAFAEIVRASREGAQALDSFKIGGVSAFDVITKAIKYSLPLYGQILGAIDLWNWATGKSGDASNDAAMKQDKLAQKTQAATDAIKQQNDEMQKSIDLIYKRINADLGVEGAQISLQEAIVKTDKTLADSTSTDLEKQKAVLDSKQAIDRFVDAIRAQAIASGVADGNIQSQIDTLTYLKGTLAPDSPLISYLDQYIGRLNGIQSDITTRVNVIYDVTTMGNAAPPGIYEGPPPYPTGGFDGDIWTPFARGGVVTGPTRALIGEAGPEAVIPLGKGAGMGTTIQLVVDGRVLTQIVRDDLIKIGRANGSALGQYA